MPAASVLRKKATTGNVAISRVIVLGIQHRAELGKHFLPLRIIYVPLESTSTNANDRGNHATMNSQKQQDHRNLQPTSYDGFRTLSIAPRLHLFNIGLHNRSDESYHWQPSDVRG